MKTIYCDRNSKGNGTAILIGCVAGVVAACLGFGQIPPLPPTNRPPIRPEDIPPPDPLVRVFAGPITNGLFQPADGTATKSRLAPLNSLWLSSSKSRFVLNLFDDAEFVVEVEKRQILGSAIVWVGHIDGIPSARVVIARQSESMAASVLVPGRGAYRVFQRRDGEHQIDEAQLSHSDTAKREMANDAFLISYPSVTPSRELGGQHTTRLRDIEP